MKKRCPKRTKYTQEQLDWTRRFWPTLKVYYCEQHKAWHPVPKRSTP